MPDWTKSMIQSFEYYEVDPATWRDRRLLTNIVSCSISRDLSAETLGSASFNIVGSISECYIRVYLVTVQNDLEEKHPLGTFLVQTPSRSFDGVINTVQVDAYTPLLELKENKPEIGYFIAKNSKIADQAYVLCREHMRAPIVKATSSDKLEYDFVANSDDSWLKFLGDFIANAKMQFLLDGNGSVMFSPIQDINSMRPTWTFDDGNSSILYPSISITQDIYGIPNVIEVLYTKSSRHYYKRLVNDDPNSPISTVNRGREIVYRIVDPEISGTITQSVINDYATRAMKQLTSVENTVSYSHAYCPVTIGDCVSLDYETAGMTNIKAKVISQSIECVPGCPVSETAVFLGNVWR